MASGGYEVLPTGPMAETLADVESGDDQIARDMPAGRHYQQAMPVASGSALIQCVDPLHHVLFNAILLGLSVPAATIGTISLLHWQFILVLYVLNALVDSAIIAQVAVKLLVLGHEFWNTAWNTLDLVIALFSGISLSVMFVSPGGVVFTVIIAYTISTRTAFHILRLLPAIITSVKGTRTASVTPILKEATQVQDLFNPACYPGAYALLYLVMASLSCAAFGMGVGTRWPKLAFNIVGIIANSLALCEIGLRFCVLRTKFLHSIWNCVDVSLSVLSIVGISTSFISPIEMDIACFLVFLRSVLQLMRISVLVRWGLSPQDAEDMSVEYAEAHSVGTGQKRDLNMGNGFKARLWHMCSSFSVPFGSRSSAIRLEGDRPLEPDSETVIFDEEKELMSETGVYKPDATAMA